MLTRNYKPPMFVYIGNYIINTNLVRKFTYEEGKAELRYTPLDWESRLIYKGNGAEHLFWLLDDKLKACEHFIRVENNLINTLHVLEFVHLQRWDKEHVIYFEPADKEAVSILYRGNKLECDDVFGGIWNSILHKQ